MWFAITNANTFTTVTIVAIILMICDSLLNYLRMDDNIHVRFTR